MSNDDDNDEIKLTLFKKKKKKSNIEVAQEYNHNAAREGKNAGQPKMLHSPVRKRKDRKQLLAFICKDCQDYYSTRDLTEKQLTKLVQDCSRHRGHHSPYRSPNRFWDTDFPSSQESTTKAKRRKSDSSANKVSSLKLPQNDDQQDEAKSQLLLDSCLENDIETEDGQSTKETSLQ